MEQQPLVIIGSSRRQGDTLAFVEKAMHGIPHHLVNLLDYSIAPYSYENSYPADDSFASLSILLMQHQLIILATPVYWYSMSGPMKIFFDRLTDLTTFQKTSGRQLKGKHLLLLAVGTDPDLPPGFHIPFERTCNYLNMHFLGSLYRSTESPEPVEEAVNKIELFHRKINESLSGMG